MTGWHPVALAAGLEPGTAEGTRLFGRELVVWRDESGQSHVWEDRCPHRGMRLSFGFVRGDRLACLYHGWQFDGAGQCRHIPSHPALTVPGTIRAPVEPSAERLGMVWTGAGPGLPPDEPMVPVRSLALRAPAEAVLAALATVQDGPFGAGLLAEPTGPVLMLQDGTHRLAAAVQPLSGTESTLHLVILGDAACYRGAGQAQVSLWAEALRRAAEAPR
jgi:phenylpropionate dioxygenase-like ring-hydroxylating dioxygenase large terminal subunit